jgi:hypothetical protein
MRLIHISKLKDEKGIPYHPQHIRKLVRQGKFPRPIHCGHFTTFDEAEIDEHLEALKAARDSTMEASHASASR